MLSGILILLVCPLLLNVQAANWAILTAGSNTYGNYRHQSDIFHAYQILISKKFDPQHIITFAYDDIAKSSSNPFPGKVFNKPTFDNPGVDVYEGVVIDYKGADVNPTVFLDVLKGNKQAVEGKGTGKVLESTSDDNVFLYFADHGGPGLIAFPSQYLYADKLLDGLAAINGKYKKFVFYLQTCESGSMFVNLPKDTKMYAVSAANPSESSWGYYCSPNDVIQGKHINSCLGDLFSINFLEDMDVSDEWAETLQNQFEIVKNKTNLSHVMQWGDQSFISDMTGNYISQARGFQLRKVLNKMAIGNSQSAMNSRTAKVQTLTSIYARQKTEQSYKEMKQQMTSMQKYDNIFYHIFNNLSLKGTYDPKIINFNCLRSTIDHFETQCGKLSDYALTYAKFFAEACEKYPAQQIIKEIKC